MVERGAPDEMDGPSENWFLGARWSNKVPAHSTVKRYLADRRRWRSEGAWTSLARGTCMLSVSWPAVLLEILEHERSEKGEKEARRKRVLASGSGAAVAPDRASWRASASSHRLGEGGAELPAAREPAMLLEIIQDESGDEGQKAARRQRLLASRTGAAADAHRAGWGASASSTSRREGGLELPAALERSDAVNPSDHEAAGGDHAELLLQDTEGSFRR